MTSIQFLGAAGTVTGSRHVVEHNGRKVLLDCGLFQGLKKIRRRNWDEFPIPPESIDTVVLSHAHIDHTGWLPRLVKQGFNGDIYATPATRDLAAIMLPDSGRIQEEEAEYANRKGYSKHNPALPLYTEDDAVACIPRIRALPYENLIELGDGLNVTLRRAGHILGSAVVNLELNGPGKEQRILVYSGDLGRYEVPIIPDPDPLHRRATYVMVECTYGDRSHTENHPQDDLRQHVRRMVDENGVLIIPAFAIGRTQGILYHLRQLQLAGEIPEIPTFVDSPMACDATALYLMHREEHDEEMVRLLIGGEQPIQPDHVYMARSVRESKAIAERDGPLIIISASGMASGGRVLHHLKQRLPDPKTTVLFAGYQAVGSRGRRMLDGETSIRIHGRSVPIKARIGQIYGFSAHADYEGVNRWLSSVEKPPQRTFCVHGEPPGLHAMKERLAARGWPAHVPDYMEMVEL